MTMNTSSRLGAGVMAAMMAVGTLSALGTPAAQAATVNGDIVFVQHTQNDNGLYIRNANNGQVTKELGRGLERHPNWSPDGIWIAFDAPLADDGQPQVMLWNRNGQARVLTNDPHSATDPDFSPDGESIAYVNHGANGSDIATMAADGSNQEPLTNAGFNGSPDYSPDGSLISYIHSEGGRYSVRVVTPDGASDRLVYAGQSLLWGSAFSPDGSRILFSEFRGGQWDLATARLADGQTEWLSDTPDFDETHASYSPDGTRLLFTRGVPQQNGSELFTSDLAHQDLQRISEAGAPAQQGDWQSVQVADPPIDPQDPPAAPDENPIDNDPAPRNDDAPVAPPALQNPGNGNGNDAPAPGGNGPAPQPNDNAGDPMRDRAAPRLTLKGKPKAGKTYRAVQIKRIRGNAVDDSAMGTVKLGMKRLGRKCSHLRANGSMTRPKKCRYKMLTVMSGDTTNRFSQRVRSLTSGRYKLKAVAIDAAGNRAKSVHGFRIR